MRYDAEHKLKSRERVVAEAAKAIREGAQAISVAGVMGRRASRTAASARLASGPGDLLAAGKARVDRRGTPSFA